MFALIVDDQALVREGLRLLVEGHSAVKRCDVAGSLGDACAMINRGHSYGIILLDLGLPDGEGPIGVTRMRRLQPEAKVVVCSGTADPAVIQACLADGAAGYLTKNASGAAFNSALDLVLRGERYVPPEILGDPRTPSRPPVPPSGLTPRQRDVLMRMARGLANKEIAQELDMSPATVRAHVSAILRVLGVENRTQAATSPQAKALLE